MRNLLEKLKLYPSKRWMPPGKSHINLLHPFWGDVQLPEGDPDIGRFDEYIQKGEHIFEIVEDINHCDITVLPFEYSIDTESMNYIKKASDEARTGNKKILILFNSDYTYNIEIPDSIILRTSFYKSTQKDNEYAFPGWSVDTTTYSDRGFYVLPKSKLPEVSYCGYVDYSDRNKIGLKQKVKEFLKKESVDLYSIGPKIRGKAVRKLLSDKKVKTNFIIRDGFWGHLKGDRNPTRREYAENMLSSPYALVTRGAGNFSFRLYEVLSCGRIPVFINTDCVLPYDMLIDWKKYMVWIEEKEINAIGDKITAFHNKISDKDFLELQVSIRKLYEEWISPVGFYSKLYKIIKP